MGLVGEGMVVDVFLSLRKVYTHNLSYLLSLEALEKILWKVLLAMLWVVFESHFSVVMDFGL